MASIPLKLARIEWQDNGAFRISHMAEDPADYKLRNSGGACFTSWPLMQERYREAWFLWHAIMALGDGCDYDQVIEEMNKVPELFDMAQQWSLRPSDLRQAQEHREEAKDGHTSTE